MVSRKRQSTADFPSPAAKRPKRWLLLTPRLNSLLFRPSALFSVSLWRPRGEPSVKVAPSFFANIYLFLSSLVSDLQDCISGYPHLLLLRASPVLQGLLRVLGVSHSHLSNHPDDGGLQISLATRSATVGLLIVVIVSMAGWGKRFWNSGRFSPFGASAHPPSPLSDDDYSYITKDEIVPPSPTYDPHTSSQLPVEDRIILRHRGSSYPVLFRTYSIDDGLLTTGILREEAARVLDVSDPRSLKLIYKGRALKDDSRPVCNEGLKIDSEVLCVVSEDRSDLGFGAGDVTDSDWGESSAGAGRDSSPERRWKGKRPAKGPKDTSPEDTGPDPGLRPPKQSTAERSRSPSPSGQAAAPKTALGKLDELASNFNTKLLPQCVQFTSHPPSDPSRRESEHRRLTETILSEFMLKLDAVETDGDPDTRQRRRDLVKQAQEVLSGLDAVVRK